MRVCMVHGRYRSAAPSGENRVVDQESSALVEAGHRVDLFERDSDDIAGWSMARKAALPVRSVWNGQVRRDLARLLEQTCPDVVHVHNTFPLISPSVLYACRDAGVPVVATLHNYRLLCAGGAFFRDGRPCHECAAGQVAPAMRHGCYRGSRAATAPVAAGVAVHRAAWRELVAAYIFLSSPQRELMQGLGLPAGRVFVKHNLVPAPAFTSVPKERSVVYLGRLDAAKGLPLLMDAWDLHRARTPAATLRLTIVGSGPLEEQVRRWAETDPTVDVLGQLPADEAGGVLRRALVAVVPSLWEETFGLVAVEAMAAGVPPVAPAHGSFPELVTDGVDGALFDPGDPVGLARVLADVDADAEAYVARGHRARATYCERFDPAAAVEQLLAIYRFAVDNPVRRPGVSA